MRTLLVATGSKHKLTELQRLFGGLPLTLITIADLGISDESPEDGATFEENAVQKARFYAAQSGHCTLADDSGLEVDALNGAPGVYTRRYAGADATDQQNYEKLLTALSGLPRAQRGARFVCCMALVDPSLPSSEPPRIFRGERRGEITEGPRSAADLVTIRSLKLMAAPWPSVHQKRRISSAIAARQRRSLRRHYAPNCSAKSYRDLLRRRRHTFGGTRLRTRITAQLLTWC